MSSTSDPNASTKTLPAWRVALVWTALSALAAVGVTPYVLAMFVGKGDKPLPPVAAIVASLVLQTAVLSFLLAWGGTVAGRKLGLERPLVEALLAGQRPRAPLRFWIPAFVGVCSGLVVVAMDTVFSRWMPAPIGGVLPRPTPLQGALACFYGGITEEVLMRLGLTTLFAWGAARLLGAERRSIALWIGVVVAALLFGAGHLPAASQLWPLSPMVVARTLLLNGIVGIVAGAFYLKKGLEHAMVLHFSADVVLHVMLPALTN